MPDLPFKEQLTLVAELRIALKRPGERMAAVDMLRSLHGRRDLYFVTWQELDELLRKEDVGNGP
ncbi:hypothetical protein [Modestobacter marinus]|uniref:hypothetical protein n=1 Tax=Modestobacter marinus TaxID=477641 RepID=UPI001C95BD18|nr:hypothetical protein [Modestobacter marinus]